MLNLQDIDTSKRYQRYFSRLVQLEREEEMSLQLREIHLMSGKKRQQKGRALLDLSGKDAGTGIGGVYQVKLTTGKRLPNTEISQGDVVIASQGEPDGKEMQAVVVEKTPYHLLIAYDKIPPSYVYGHRVRLDLFANDVTFQRMLEALRQVHERHQLTGFLLEKEVPHFQAEELASFFNPKLNDRQKEAVSKAVAADNLFLIHGPPGTGKTTTLIEVIRQHVKLGKKVLVATDSNTAVDNMVEKLLGTEVRVVRLGNPVRVQENLRTASLSYLLQDEEPYQQANSNWSQVAELRTEQDLHMRPSGKNRRGLSDREIQSLAKKGIGGRGVPSGAIRKMATWIRIQKQINRLIDEAQKLEKKAVEQLLEESDVVCATNASSGTDLLKDWRFQVVVVDEASQATEPSCLIPMVKGKKWILAGDHKQLPPTIMSAEARELHNTLFERWMRNAWEDHAILLTIQYRMNETLMQFCNEQFYHNRLKAHPSVKQITLDSLPGYTALPGVSPGLEPVNEPSVPLVFIDVPHGIETRLKDAYSWRNEPEAEVVQRVTDILLGSRIFPEDIGVISPYASQVELLKQKLELYGVEINSIDGFQGREKEVIIVSLVRSNHDGELGFLTDYRRLNVALTRARRKLVVIGRKDSLKTNDFYGKFIVLSQSTSRSGS